MSLLDRLVLIRFSEDVMIKPGYSAVKYVYLTYNTNPNTLFMKKKWFWVDNEQHELIPLHNRTLFKDDRLGLKSLDEMGHLEFLVCPGQHVRGLRA